MNEAYALRALAAAIERRDAMLELLPENAARILAANDGLRVHCDWASAVEGHKELMAALGKAVRARVDELLVEVRTRADIEVEQCRAAVAAAQAGKEPTP